MSKQASKFRDKFYENQRTKKYFLMQGETIKGQIFVYTLPSSVEVFVAQDDENLVDYDLRTPVRASGYGYDKQSSAIATFYRKFAKSISADELRLIDSGCIEEFYAGRNLKLIG